MNKYNTLTSIVGRTMLALVVGGVLASCTDDPVASTQPTISVPTAYSFKSRFDSTKSSVSYGGQIVRQLLIQDLKTVIDNLGKAGASPVEVADLLKYYEHKDADNLSSLTTTGTLPVKETKYSTISTGKDLKGKISSDVVTGTGKNADALIREWFQIISDNSKDPSKLGTSAVYTDSQGHNLSQLINKLLLGSVAYYQATGVYLNDLLTKDNVARSGTEPYTVMEHSWDEAFGYFGAARDFARYTDAQLSGAVADYVHDSNADGAIDLATEFNYAIARNAGKRDKDASGVDFSKDAFDAFLKGRTAIVNKGTTADITAHRTAVVNTFEKIIAATVVHYINDVIKDMATLTNESNAQNSNTLNGHWGEMKGYAWALQYSPFKLISTTQLEELHYLLGDAAVYAAPGTAEHTAYLTKLNSARDILKTAYSFSTENTNSW
jgi:hypothetical protein